MKAAGLEAGRESAVLDLKVRGDGAEPDLGGLCKKGRAPLREGNFELFHCLLPFLSFP